MTDQEDAAERRGVIKRLWTAIILCSIFMIVEVIGGVLSGSLAILSDAAHLFSDLASFAVAIGASHLATLPATTRYTFGLKRAESLAALFSAISLVVVSVGLMYTAVQRLVAPPEEGVDGSLMSFISGIGVLVNVALAFVLGEHHVHLPGGDHGHDHSHNHGSHADDHGHTHAHGHGHHAENDGEEDSHDHDSHDHDSHDHDSHDHSHHNDHDHRHSHHEDSHEQLNETTPLVLSYGGHDHEEHHSEKHTREKQRNVNLHAAYLHVMGDLAQSLAVFLGGLAIWWKPDWHSIDAILTLGFSIIVLWSTVGVIRSSVGVLLEETPIDIDWQEVYDAVSAAPNVTGVHDLHIWCISHGQVALSLHCFSSDDNAISNINKACLKFGIKHTTIQVNRGQGCTCQPSECCTSQIKVNNEL